MSRYTFLIALIAFVFSLSSCLTTKTDVGIYRQQTGDSYTYAKSKQVWILWGWIPMGRTNTATPPDRNCRIITRFNLVDVLISGLTGGIVITRTIKVKAKSRFRTDSPTVEPTDSSKTTPNPTVVVPTEPNTEPNITPAKAEKKKPFAKVKLFFAKLFKRKDKTPPPPAAVTE